MNAACRLVFVDFPACRKQKLRIRVMFLKSPLCQILILDSVAVNAPVRAGVVFADVAGLEAAALLAIALELRGKTFAGDRLESIRVDTSGVNGAGHEVVPL